MTSARPSPAAHSSSAGSPVVNRASVWHRRRRSRATLLKLHQAERRRVRRRTLENRVAHVGRRQRPRLGSRVTVDGHDCSVRARTEHVGDDLAVDVRARRDRAAAAVARRRPPAASRPRRSRPRVDSSRTAAVRGQPVLWPRRKLRGADARDLKVCRSHGRRPRAPAARRTPRGRDRRWRSRRARAGRLALSSTT